MARSCGTLLAPGDTGAVHSKFFNGECAAVRGIEQEHDTFVRESPPSDLLRANLMQEQAMLARLQQLSRQVGQRVRPADTLAPTG
jgi:hypothetical protein